MSENVAILLIDILTLKDQIIQMIKLLRKQITASWNGYVKIVICILKVVKASFPQAYLNGA